MSEEELKIKVNEICLGFSLFQKILNSSFSYEDNPELISPTNIVLSSKYGKDLYLNLQKIMLFWVKVYNPNLTLEIIPASIKIFINAIAGDKWYSKLTEVWNNNSRKGNPLEDKQINKKPNFFKLTDDEHDIIGTMTVIVFSGIIEDFLNILRDQISKKTKLPKFRRLYKDSSLTEKINVLIQGMELESFINEEINKYSNGNQIIEEFDKFRILRNQIAHNGAQIKFLSLKEEIANISEYVGKFIFNDLDKTEFKLKSQKELMYNHFPKFLPILSYIFILYFKFYSYILVLDYSYVHWDKKMKFNNC